MNIGFIGAGRVGFSLGKYFSENGINVSGYYSKNPMSAKAAADFASGTPFETVGALLEHSDIVFVTVPDDSIASVWRELKLSGVFGKILCHCSGALESCVFDGCEAYGCSCCSVHPLLAVSDKLTSYEKFKSAVFTVEGRNESAELLTKILESCSNKVVRISPENKSRYHAAAVMVSNLSIALTDCALSELERCGFSRKTALDALSPLIFENTINMLKNGLENSLTGPVERNDVYTVKKHLNTLSGDSREIYRLLSVKAMNIAELKNTDRNYNELGEILSE